MNNGDYLNTLNNKDKAREIYNKTNFKSYDEIFNYLQAEYDTTADEDFTTMGYELVDTNDLSDAWINYRHRYTGISFVISRDSIWFYASDSGTGISAESVQKIEIIAKKKRKEKWLV